MGLNTGMIKDRSAIYKVTFADRAENGLEDREERSAERSLHSET